MSNHTHNNKGPLYFEGLFGGLTEVDYVGIPPFGSLYYGCWDSHVVRVIKANKTYKLGDLIDTSARHLVHKSTGTMVTQATIPPEAEGTN